MSTPDPYDEGHIADTGTFQRFVDHEREMESAEIKGTGKARLWAIVAIVVIIAIAIAVWLLTR